jgi:hypothetical protein
VESTLSRLARLFRLAGLGLAVGAVLQGTASAQRPDSTRARADSARARALRDSLRTAGDTLRTRADSLRARRDSIAADSAKADSLMREDLRNIAAAKKRADTVKTPTPTSEMPVLTDLDEGLRWDRASLFASGALTLADLLERVPELTILRAGWLGAPQVAAFAGDFTRVRVFSDGVELDPLDPRNGGMNDLAFIPIWHLEEVRIERGASEVRIHLRSWQVRSVTPSTRVDMGTGDLETNGYRGYFGRRFAHGEALQLGAYQLSSRDNRAGGDADQLSLFGRVGWAKGRFSADASFLTTAIDRSELSRLVDEGANLPPHDGTNTNSYLRLQFADPRSGIWLQLMAAASEHEQARLADTSSADSAAGNVVVGRSQYIAAAGWSRNALSLSATARVRDIFGEKKFAPSMRAAYETPRLTMALFGEQQPELDLRRLELSGRVRPLSFLSFGGAVSRFATTGGTSSASSLTYRGEVGLRIHRAWLTFGLLSRDSAALVPPLVFDSVFAPTIEPAAKGTFLTLRGKVWKDIGFDVSAIKWDSGGAYRPTYQARSQIYINTGMLHKFPSGNLNILAALTHEYRTAAYFPLASGELLASSQYRSWNFLLEIRLLAATLSYQFRNLLNEQYTQVPGFRMPRPVQFYGVRWDFFN